MASLADLTALENLWTNSGGNPSLAPRMAAIADAESGLNASANVSDPTASDPNARSYGLFQINSPNFPALGLTATTALDPATNTKAAIALAGPQGAGLSNWSTWTSYLASFLPNAALTSSQRQAASTVASDLTTLGVAGATPSNAQPGGLIAGLVALAQGKGLAGANTAATTANAQITATQNGALTAGANILSPFGFGVLAIVGGLFLLAFLLSSGGTSVSVSTSKAAS